MKRRRASVTRGRRGLDPQQSVGFLLLGNNMHSDSASALRDLAPKHNSYRGKQPQLGSRDPNLPLPTHGAKAKRDTGKRLTHARLALAGKQSLISPSSQRARCQTATWTVSSLCRTLTSKITGR